MTVVCATDEMVKRYGSRALAPLPFRVPPDGYVRAEPRPAGVARARTRPTGPSVHYRPQALARFTLRLSDGGLEAIRRELGWGAAEGVEVGGYLWSHQRARSDGVVIAHVSPPAEGSRHGPTAVRLGTPERVAAAWPDWLQRSQLVCVGCCHSHPITDGSPSRPDREAWAERVRRTGFAWASLIVSRGEDGIGWMDPGLAGWVTSRDRYVGYIVEPATVADVRETSR